MLLIKNISNLLTMDYNLGSALGEISQGAVLIKEEKIIWAGPENNLPKNNITKIIDAQNCVVMPGFIDCHTHMVFAGSRAQEFSERMQNKSYEEILKSGGGIHQTVTNTRQASEEELFNLAQKRIEKIFSLGVTTMEIKSGYGLSLEHELRILRVIKKLKQKNNINIHATFLGAHVIPKKFKQDPESYIKIICEDMLPKIAQENLAIDCDVFCENGAYNLSQARKIFNVAQKLGFGLRAHVQQLGQISKGVKLLKEFKLKSISHADFLDDQDIDLILEAKTVVEILPIANLFLRSRQITPVAKLIKKNIPIAIATDFNPGSAMCNNIILAARLACVYMGCSVEQALLGITYYGAKALGQENIGVIKNNYRADLVITKCNKIADIMYDWTSNPVDKVICGGKLY